LPNQRITQACYDPPHPNTNGQLHQWEDDGLSHANNAFGVGFIVNDENFDAAGALVQISGTYQGRQIQN
jgi:hypothetical protein